MEDFKIPLNNVVGIVRNKKAYCCVCLETDEQTITPGSTKLYSLSRDLVLRLHTDDKIFTLRKKQKGTSFELIIKYGNQEINTNCTEICTPIGCPEIYKSDILKIEKQMTTHIIKDAKSPQSYESILDRLGATEEKLKHLNENDDEIENE